MNPANTQVRLSLTRGVVATVWAVVFATVSDSLTTGVGALLVLYQFAIQAWLLARHDHGTVLAT